MSDLLFILFCDNWNSMTNLREQDSWSFGDHGRSS